MAVLKRPLNRNALDELTLRRKVAQLTQMQLAVRAGIDQADLSRLETGQGVRGATIGFVERVAHALGREVVIRFVDPASKADSAGVTLSH
jgi:transcriptional regulator with XRE-family HTH domain